ncbi:TlpA family protein disulfide reductase [Sphingobacterium multivorum]|jgi:thiol-disulfide isomerase/thioredoxin|uniref:TlpA family protein disulfide reductase n=2 Tax=Sphingobacterium multivorum TaxID=28454 RepID=UPI000DFFC3AC|nr:TlpA disulfide reductase family protein [Sphingobacterium multivorum]HAL53576.1 hypothetical protein [Sphingobacterium sp.]MDF2851332.1 redoxin protein [Sphingobacterium multivorum]QQT46298.1 TlpA family protein disulfide reductase [Sphingobacterium multivorum]QQT61160.1 TlpA family protein disulfide reductase [Sphingobacterium multivorum]SUJ31976.1 Thiol-disulfide oxidoreductase resA [Sphingobacterium multivorum]
MGKRSTALLAIVSFLLSMPLIILGQRNNGFIIQGKIDTVPNAKYRIMYRNNEKKIDDSLQLSADRTFTFHGSIGEPTRVNFIIDNDFNPRRVKDQIVYSFWVSPGDTVDFHGLTGWLVGPKSNLRIDDSKYVLKGSTLDKIAITYGENRRAIYLSNKDQEKATGLEDSIISKFIQSNPNSFYSLYLLNKSFSSLSRHPDLLNTLYNALSTEQKNSFTGILLNKKVKAQPQLEIGKSLPIFELANDNGNLVSLEDFRGKYVLVEFWASWCGPCRKEFPLLQSLYSEYKSKNFEILAVSIDESRMDWLTAINNEKLLWTNVRDKGGFSGELYQIFGLKGVPDNFLLDKEGKIVARNLRSSELKKVLDKLISDN